MLQSSTKTNMTGQYKTPGINQTTVYGSNISQTFSKNGSQKALTHQIKTKDKIPKPQINNQTALQIIEVQMMQNQSSKNKSNQVVVFSKKKKLSEVNAEHIHNQMMLSKLHESDGSTSTLEKVRYSQNASLPKKKVKIQKKDGDKRIIQSKASHQPINKQQHFKNYQSEVNHHNSASGTNQSLSDLLRKDYMTTKSNDGHLMVDSRENRNMHIEQVGSKPLFIMSESAAMRGAESQSD